MSPQRVVTALGLLLLSVVVSTAYAHKVNVFAYVEGDQVYIQGYFSDGSKAKNSDVTVYASDGRELTKGQTDEDGAFTFPTQDKQQALHVVLNAGMGHQAAYDIPADEMAGATAAPATTTPPASEDPAPRADEPHAGGDSAAPAQISEAAIRKAVAEGVLPLAREISELKERRGFSDIVGGIGFIVGVLGMVAYLKARQETRRVNKDKG
jgi:nickel transport protein